MNWTEPKSPNKEISSYDHTICETPLGIFRIEWKSWKENPSFSIDLDDKYIGTEYDLDRAKYVATQYLMNKHLELSDYIVTTIKLK